MAITRPIAQDKIPTTEDERTSHATISTPVGGDYSITVSREIVRRDAKGTVVGGPYPAQPVYRKASSILNESVTVELDGKRVDVPAALIMAALPEFFDRWATEDSNDA